MLHKLLVTAAALLTIGTSTGVASASDTPAGGWLIGTWVLCEDPDKSPKESLKFEEKGVGAVLSATGNTQFQYRISGLRVTLLFDVKGRSLKMDFSASANRDKLLLYSKRTGNTSTYVRSNSPDAKHCSIK